MYDTKNNSGNGLDWITEVHLASFCITDISDLIFSTISICSIVIVLMHFVLIFSYPYFHVFVFGDLEKDDYEMENDDDYNANADDDEIDKDDDDRNEKHDKDDNANKMLETIA
jgi:hypothetical protein